ncbi:MAG: ISNCY family transposase [Bacteroidetes bacterium]|nr:ISNCY family transposase [Bacteroidota bacterium]
MNRKETIRLEQIISIEAGKISHSEASKLLGLSRRQVIRVRKSYRLQGALGLVSKRRENPSNNRVSENTRSKILELIGSTYTDFGPTFLREKLVENHDITVSKETLRQLMITNGLWDTKRRKKACIHQQRERRSRFGELVQIDGSPHDWFEGRREKCCLLVFIDDAAGKILQLRFEETETTAGYFKATHDYIKQYGLPIAFYSDKHGIFRVNAPETIHEGKTQFKRAMDNLGIEIIYANSPQAKGRVERANKTLQDRLTKELRLAGISDIETANAFLPEFIKKYNQKFAVEPKSKNDAHRQLQLSDEELNLVFSTHSTRTLSKNLELSYNNVVYQIQVFGQGYTLRHAKILVCEDLSGYSGPLV